MKSTMKNVIRFIEYPKAYKHTESDLVVMFIGETVGTVIHSSDDRFEVGSFMEYWIPYTNSDEWEEFKGVIELDFGV